MSLYEENILEDDKVLQRFWDKVEVIHPDDPDACYGWTAKKDKNGCGIFCMHCPQLEGRGLKRTWKSFRAPRLMWILEHDQSIPAGLLVIHSCDDESCVNPRHIRIGTYKDNSNDRRLRGRFDTGPKGEDHPNSTLTTGKVRKICHLYFVKKMKAKQIAEKFGIVTATVHGIVIGRSWKHVTKTHIPKGFLHKYKACKLRNSKMYKAFKDGWTYNELAEEYGISAVYTRQIMMAQRKLHGDPPTPAGFRSNGRKKKK